MSLKLAHFDFETFGFLELKEVGLYNYATDARTGVHMLGYKLPGYSKPALWLPNYEEMPGDVRDALRDPEQLLAAWNSSFERYIFQYQLGIELPTYRWHDPQVSARYLSMPGKLDVVGEILNLPYHMRKDKRGEALIDLFSLPQKAKKKRGEEQQYYFNTRESHPEEFAQFGEYCMRDVVAEEEIARREEILDAFPMPAFEREVWIFDQAVNDRGMPVDVDFVEKAYKIAMRGKAEALEFQNKLTGLENANSPTQLLPWLRERGYPFNTLRKDTVAVVLKDPEINLTPEARTVLETRKEAASTSYTKLSAILRQVGRDGNLHNQFIFMGSSRCGRWSGNAVQLHNMARPDDVFEDMDNINKARKMVYEEDYDALNTTFIDSKTKKPIPALLVIRSLIRTVFVAPDGKPAKPVTVAIEDGDE